MPKNVLRGWKDLVLDVIQSFPSTFTLADVAARKGVFIAAYPNNRHIDAKIRQTLQILRDQGSIQFLGNGRYRRLDAMPAFSPLLPAEAGAGYVSRAQFARAAIETWAEMNMYCVHCSADGLVRLPANTPVADFECAICSTRYQLKAKNGRFTRFVTGAAYEPTIAAVRAGLMPAHVLVEFDDRYATVVFVDAIRGDGIGESRVVARKALSSTAKRAGWVGCTLDIAELPRVRVVAPQGRDRGEVRTEWRTLAR